MFSELPFGRASKVVRRSLLLCASAAKCTWFSSRPRPGGAEGSARLEGLFQLVHEELVDAAGDLLEEFLAVGQVVLASGVVGAAAGALRRVDAVGGRSALAVRELEVRRGAAQVEGLHGRRHPVAVLR